MTRPREPLDPAEVAKAIVAAILVPVVPVTLLFSAAAGPLIVLAFPYALLFGVTIAALHVLPLWLPAYLMLRRVGAMGWWQAALLGFLCGGGPSYIFAFPAPSSGGIGIFLGLCGLVGGLAFHWRLERLNI